MTDTQTTRGAQGSAEASTSSVSSSEGIQSDYISSNFSSIEVTVAFEQEKQFKSTYVSQKKVLTCFPTCCSNHPPGQRCQGTPLRVSVELFVRKLADNTKDLRGSIGPLRLVAEIKEAKSDYVITASTPASVLKSISRKAATPNAPLVLGKMVEEYEPIQKKVGIVYSCMIDFNTDAFPWYYSCNSNAPVACCVGITILMPELVVQMSSTGQETTSINLRPIAYFDSLPFTVHDAESSYDIAFDDPRFKKHGMKRKDEAFPHMMQSMPVPSYPHASNYGFFQPQPNPSNAMYSQTSTAGAPAPPPLYYNLASYSGVSYQPPGLQPSPAVSYGNYSFPMPTAAYPPPPVAGTKVMPPQIPPLSAITQAQLGGDSKVYRPLTLPADVAAINVRKMPPSADVHRLMNAESIQADMTKASSLLVEVLATGSNAAGELGSNNSSSDGNGYDRDKDKDSDTSSIGLTNDNNSKMTDSVSSEDENVFLGIINTQSGGGMDSQSSFGVVEEIIELPMKRSEPMWRPVCVDNASTVTATAVEDIVELPQKGDDSVFKQMYYDRPAGTLTHLTSKATIKRPWDATTEAESSKDDTLMKSVLSRKYLLTESLEDSGSIALLALMADYACTDDVQKYGKVLH